MRRIKRRAPLAGKVFRFHQFLAARGSFAEFLIQESLLHRIYRKQFYACAELRGYLCA